MLELIKNNMTVVVMIFCLIGGFLLGKITSHKKVKKERKDAVKRSRSVLGGLMSEQIAPYLPEFPCNPADVRFIGKPCDFVGFCGLAEKNEIEKVVFIEVKTGSASLNAHERQLKECIEKGKVEYRICRL